MQFEYIIPMGEECYTCGSIDSKFNTVSIRKCSFPFDYVGHVFIEQITKKCKELLIEGNETTLANLEIKLFDNDYFFSDATYNFHYWHDTTHKNPELFTLAEKQAFVDKYIRRYNRLKLALLSGKPVLCISVNHFDNIYNGVFKKESLIELYKLLNSYNPLLKFIGINYDPESFTEGNLEHISLQYDTNIPFQESKILFTSTLYDYMKTLEIWTNGH